MNAPEEENAISCISRRSPLISTRNLWAGRLRNIIRKVVAEISGNSTMTMIGTGTATTMMTTGRVGAATGTTTATGTGTGVTTGITKRIGIEIGTIIEVAVGTAMTTRRRAAAKNGSAVGKGAAREVKKGTEAARGTVPRELGKMTAKQ